MRMEGLMMGGNPQGGSWRRRVLLLYVVVGLVALSTTPKAGATHQADSQSARQDTSQIAAEDGISLSEAIALALKNNPEIEIARYGVEAQAAERDQAAAEYWPWLFVQGSYGIHAAPWPEVQPEGVDAWADVGQVGLVLNDAVFNGWRVASAGKKQQASLGASVARLHHLELRVRLEVESAALRVKAARARVALAQKATAEAQEAFRIETEKQAVGKSTISDVLTAQADFVDAEATQSRALAEANIALAALKLAIGERP